MAVMSWAQTPVRMGANLLPEQFATKAAKMTKHTLEKKERTPHQLLKAPAQQAKVKWAKRNPEKLINLNPPAILTGSGPTTYIVKNYAFTETNYGTSEEPDIQLEPAAMERFTESWTITPTDDAANTVEIIGINNGYETVTATIDATANTITIPYRQKAAVTEYGDVYLFNYTGKENLVGTITSEGIVFADLWYTAFIDGEYAGWAHDDSYYNYTSERFSKVAIDGTDIYIQGLLPQCPYGWAKGVISGTTVTIPRMQCQGCSDGEYVFLTSFDIESMEFKDLVFEYNADEDIYMTYDMLIGNTNTEELSILPPYLSGMTIGTEKIPELAQLPEGAEVKEYPFVGQHVVDGYALEFERTVNVAVVDNDVYLQGLNSVVPDAWVKGTNVGDGIVIFPTGQNFGVDETKDLDGNVFFTQQYFFVGGNYQTGKIEDVIMIYNAEKNYNELQNELMVSNKKSTIEIVEWYLHGTTIGQKEESNLPPLMTITVPEDFQREIWTLEAPEMIYEEENFTAQVYKSEDEIKTWKKIGVQSIYYGGGERNVSNIIWAENPAYDGDETGIANIGKDSQAPKVYFNLQGHRVTAPAKGLYIVNGKKVVIK